MEPEVYKAMYEREERFWWHRGMQAIIARLLKRFFVERGDLVILDAGCGTGGMFSLLSTYGSVIGVDSSESALRYATQRGMTVRQASVEHLPFPDNSFDLITCLDVLYHQNVGSDQQALAEFFRVLRPDGVLLVREAAYEWLKSGHDRVVWTKHRYTRGELTAKISSRGFHVQKSTYAVFFLFPFALFSRGLKNFFHSVERVEDLFTAGPIINAIFTAVLKLEARLLPYINFPFGLSIFVVARKSAAQTIAMPLQMAASVELRQPSLEVEA